MATSGRSARRTIKVSRNLSKSPDASSQSSFSNRTPLSQCLRMAARSSSMESIASPPFILAWVTISPTQAVMSSCVKSTEAGISNPLESTLSVDSLPAARLRLMASRATFAFVESPRFDISATVVRSASPLVRKREFMTCCNIRALIADLSQSIYLPWRSCVQCRHQHPYDQADRSCTRSLLFPCRNESQSPRPAKAK